MKQRIDEIKRMQKLAGILKEDDSNSLIEKFKEADINLNEPVVTVDDYTPRKINVRKVESGEAVLDMLTVRLGAGKAEYYLPTHPAIVSGDVFLMGDGESATEGMSFKLAVVIMAAGRPSLIEIYQ